MKEGSTGLGGLAPNEPAPHRLAPHRPAIDRTPEPHARRYEPNGPALELVERLEAACHTFILHFDQDVAREELKRALRLDAGNCFDTVSPLSPLSSVSSVSVSPVSSLATVAAVHKASIVALLGNKRISNLELRGAVARFCQTLTSMHGLMSGGRRLVAGGPRLVT